MTRGTFALWVYLSRTPLLSLTVTLVAYLVADRVSARTDLPPLQCCTRSGPSTHCWSQAERPIRRISSRYGGARRSADARRWWVLS
jgi:hypothetical protein